VLTPYRDNRVVCVDCRFTGAWRAALCAHEGLPLGLGHALSRQASPGGKAKNETINAPTMAVRLRGSLLPRADGSPAERRATRAGRRRRMDRRRTRAELLPHLPKTNSQYDRPALGKTLAYKANREGGAAPCPAPAVQQSTAVDLARSGDDAHRLRALEWSLAATAKPHAPNTLSLLRTGPGIGKSLRRVRLDESHDLRRCPREQACGPSGRLGTAAKASAGTRDGTAGTTIGHADLQGTVSAAAVLVLRDNPAGKKALARIETNHGLGKALTSRAHP